jgi:pimeloyl-ACP methyl ester carboxylesterase
MIWHESGGEGRRTVLLLHGLGATGAVWKPVTRVLEQAGARRWLAPDLSGHGGSDAAPGYSVGQLAAELAQWLQPEPTDELLIVGHSLGAYVGLALASGWFGIAVRAVLGIGPKIHWSEADLQAARELAARPVRHYPTQEEAWMRYRRVSGLTPQIAPGEECLARGVMRSESGWCLAQDPRTFGVAGAPFATLAASATVPLQLARGEGDSMVSLAELRVHTAQARDIPSTGHNAHIEDPAAVVELLAQLERTA